MFSARCVLCMMDRVVNTKDNIPAVMETVFEWMQQLSNRAMNFNALVVIIVKIRDPFSWEQRILIFVFYDLMTHMSNSGRGGTLCPQEQPSLTTHRL